MSDSLIESEAVISVPFYNETAWLQDTLRCLQEVPGDVPVKFFLCDNASEDGSSEIAENFAQNDSRFLHHRHDSNIGALKNFEFALANSESAYFMWLGAHDLVDSSYPAAALTLFDERPDISFAAAEPHAFKDGVESSQLMASARYNDFHGDALVRYLQSVAKLGNCTIVNSMFRRESVKSFAFRKTLSWDHVFISHVLWYGPIAYTNGHRYYRRFHDQAGQTREEKIVSATDQSDALSRADFIDFYARDFQGLYQGPEHLRAYLTNKMLEILEKRFGLQSFA